MAKSLSLIDKIIAFMDTNENDGKTDINNDNFECYLGIESCGGCVFGKNNDIIFIYNQSGNYQIYKSKLMNKQILWPQRITFNKNRCTNPRYLSDDTIIYTSDVGGNEKYGIYLIDKNNISHKLTNDINAKHKISYVSQNHVYFSANINDKIKFNMYKYKIPLLNNKPVMISSGKIGIISVNCVSKNEDKAVLFHYIHNNQSELILIENNKEAYLVSEYNNIKPCLWKGIKFLNDKLLLVSSNYECEYMRPIILNIETKKITFYVDIENTVKWDFQYFGYGFNDKYIYYIENEHGYSNLYRGIFKENGVISDMKKLKLPFKGVIGYGDDRSYTRALNISRNNELIAFTMSNTKIPDTMFVLDLKTFEYFPISNISTPGINPNAFVNSTLHSFKSFDNTVVNYFKMIPTNKCLVNNSNQYPTLIVIHGGPESQYRPTFNPVTQFFVSAGFAIIAPNIRGSRGYGITYMNKDNKDKRLDTTKDIYYLTEHLKSNDNEIDNKRLIAFGGSYGGFMVLSCLTEYPNVFIAGVDIVGISNFVTFLQNTASWRRSMREFEYGSLKDDMDLLKRISPINQINNINKPLFIIQGNNDIRVPLSESIQIYNILKNKKLNVKLLTFDDEGHGIKNTKNKIVAYGSVLKWLLNIIK